MNRFLFMSEQFGRASGRALTASRARARSLRPLASRLSLLAVVQAQLVQERLRAGAGQVRPLAVQAGVHAGVAGRRAAAWSMGPGKPVMMLAACFAWGVSGYVAGRVQPPEVRMVEGPALALPQGPVLTASFPVRPLPRPVPRPLARPEGIQVTLTEDLLCMAANIFHEARGERSELGKGMVAQVFLNRVGQPGRPKSVCGVIHQYKQASWTLDRPYVDLSKKGERMSYLEAFAIAEKALQGRYEAATAGAHMYYNPSKVTPYWESDYREVRVVGGHRFMK